MQSKNQWPAADYESMVAFYGEVGMNMVRYRPPYPLRLAWDLKTQVHSITVHQSVAESMDVVMCDLLKIYGYANIVKLKMDVWGGCLNVRKKRHGQSWSIHSWGAANDWYPQGNKLNTRWIDSAFSHPKYIPFFNAWIAEGWDPLGISWGKDVMHIQATANSVKMLEMPDHWDGRF